MGRTVDSRLLDSNSPEQIDENFNRVMDEVDGKTAANMAASTASEVAGVVADLNTLLTGLKTAGLMVADE